MSDYFSRLVSRNAARPTRPDLKPYVRSGSPIAEFDQRVGVPGFNGIGALGPNQNSTETETDPLSVASVVMASPSISPGAGGQIQRKVSITSTPSLPATATYAPKSSTPAVKPSKLASAGWLPTGGNTESLRLTTPMITPETLPDKPNLATVDSDPSLSEPIPISAKHEDTRKLDTVGHRAAVSTDALALPGSLPDKVIEDTPGGPIPVNTHPPQRSHHVSSDEPNTSIREVGVSAQTEFCPDNDMVGAVSLMALSDDGPLSKRLDGERQVLSQTGDETVGEAEHPINKKNNSEKSDMDRRSERLDGEERLVFSQLGSETTGEKEQPIIKKNNSATTISENRSNPNEAPPPTTAIGTTKPATAESVSQIGPLRRRRNSNLRFAMRQR